MLTIRSSPAFGPLGFASAGIGTIVIFLGVIISSLGVPAIMAGVVAVGGGLALVGLTLRDLHQQIRSERETTKEYWAKAESRFSELKKDSKRQMSEALQELATLRDRFDHDHHRVVWLESLLEQFPAGLLVIDRDLNVISSNQRFRAMLGVPPGPRPRSLNDFHGWPAETIDGAPIPFDEWPLMRAIRNGTRMIDFEMRVGHQNGGWFDACVSATPISDAKGQTLGAVLLMNDLTVRRQSVRRLAMLESAVVHANDAIIVLEAVGADGRGRKVMYVNDAFTRLTGYTRDEVLGRSLHFLRGVDTDSDTLRNLKIALDTATPFRTELLNYRKDGGVVWVDLSLVPVQGSDGRCLHYIMIQRDVTARKVAEGSLRESEELFRGIFETTSAGVSITNEENRFVSVNPAFASLVGRSVEELLQLTPQDISHPDDWTSQQSLIEQVRHRKLDRYQFPKRYLKPDGSIVWTELTYAAIRDADGEYQYGLGVSIDLTARRMLEEQLRQAQKMEALGQLAGGIAHDFNNLLTAIIGNLHLLKLPENGPDHELINVIEQAAQRAADLTRKLLGYARRNQLIASDVAPAKVIEEVVGILRHTFDPRITIRMEMQARQLIRVDCTLLNQAIFNLCLNARDAMPEGGMLSISTTDHELESGTLPDNTEPGPYVCITVSDTGHGIDDSIRSRLFEPFFTTKEVGKGTGLGLAMVEGIMRQHQGFVTVESAAGQGATFSLWLPASPVQVAVPVSHKPDLIPAETPPPQPATVLLVDDESMIRNLGRAILELQKFEVIEAEDGQEAVEVFEREHQRIALVVLDLTMPRLNGRDAFHRMKGIAPDVPVLFSSGYTPDDISGIDGAAGLLTKPYKPNDLLKAVRSAMRQSREWSPA